MKYIKIKERLFVYLTSFTVFFSKKKKALKYLSFFVPPTLNLKKIPVNQLIKNYPPINENKYNNIIRILLGITHVFHAFNNILLGSDQKMVKHYAARPNVQSSPEALGKCYKFSEINIHV